jgi:hypothetical protein
VPALAELETFLAIVGVTGGVNVELELELLAVD